MEDLLRDDPTPEGWSESEPNGEENSSSNEEDEGDKTDCFPFVKTIGTAPEPFPVENIDDPQIMENPAQFMDDPAILEEDLILENPAQILENPAQILENPAQILENPAQILENPAQIPENRDHIPENRNHIPEMRDHIPENCEHSPENCDHILENPALILENPGLIPQNFVRILENPAQFLENPAQYMYNPAMFIIDNPGQILEILQVPDPESNMKVRKMPEADPHTLAHYMLCQKLRQPNWKSVKYAGVKDQFQVSPGFCALKPNDLLTEITPKSKYNDHLKRFDLTCGAMVNGLIQNHMIFNETLSTLPTGMKNEVFQMFYGPESKYRKHSDALLHYTCGRRQEIMQDRRKLYKPPNKIHKKALYNIPPSETHLFEDDAFTNLVAEMKGIEKIFPKERKRRIINQNLEHGNRRKMRQNTNRETRRPE